MCVCNIIDSKRTQKIIKYLQSYGLGDAIQIFHGMDKKQLRIMVASADIIIAPSLSEGFGSVHTEAVAMKKPLITTYVASLPEVLSGTVKFIPPGSKDAIVQAVVERHIWQDHIHIPPKTFSWEDTIQSLVHLYHKVLPHKI